MFQSKSILFFFFLEFLRHLNHDYTDDVNSRMTLLRKELSVSVLIIIRKLHCNLHFPTTAYYICSFVNERGKKYLCRYGRRARVNKGNVHKFSYTHYLQRIKKIILNKNWVPCRGTFMNFVKITRMEFRTLIRVY